MAGIGAACGCGDDWRQRKIEIRTDTREHFFEDANYAHNLINAAIHGPVKRRYHVPIAEAYGIWRKSGEYEPLLPAAWRTPTVDVVIPFHAGDAQFVREAVEAILAQRFVRPIVHVVADGCDWPDLPDGVLKYEAAGGVGPYRIANAIAMHHAWGLWLAIQDADDVSHPDRLWRQVATMERYGYEMTSCSAANFTNDPTLVGRLSNEPVVKAGRVYSTVPYGRHVNTTRMMTRAMFLRLNGFADMMCVGDFEFDNRAHLAGVPSFWSSDVLADRRLQGESLTNGDRFRYGTSGRADETRKLEAFLAQMKANPHDAAAIGAVDRAPDLRVLPVTRPAAFGRPRLKVVTALSQLPKHLERQSICLDSWLAFGVEIYAMNTAAEISSLRDRYPQVAHWIANEELCSLDHYAYPTQLIRNMARLAIDLDDTVLLINSDIELHGLRSILDKYLRDDTQVMGIRWDYVGEDRKAATQFQWGIDLFSFTPNMARALPADFPFAVGHPVWDYAVPMFSLMAGFKLQFVHERLLYHQAHDIHWSKPAWLYGSQWLTERTELDVVEELQSGLYRESLDPGCFYEKDRRLYITKNGKQPACRLPGPSLEGYRRWRMVQSERAAFRKGESRPT